MYTSPRLNRLNSRVDQGVTRVRGILPVIGLAVLLVVTLVTTSVWAILRGDVIGVPYVSDTGSEAPERSIFSIGLGLGAVVASAIVWLRYKQLALTLESAALPARLTSISVWSCRIGIGSCLFGMMVTANFQDTEVLIVHVLGASITFGGGMVYMCMQTYLTYVVDDRQRQHDPAVGMMRTAGLSANQLTVARCRAALSVGSAISLVLIVVFGAISFETMPTIADLEISNATCAAQVRLWPSAPPIWDGKAWPGLWPKCMAGYSAHVASAACEWSVVALFILFFASFAAELKFFECEIRLTRIREGQPTAFLLLDENGAEVEDVDASTPHPATSADSSMSASSGGEYGGLRDSLLP